DNKLSLRIGMKVGPITATMSSWARISLFVRIGSAGVGFITSGSIFEFTDLASPVVAENSRGRFTFVGYIYRLRIGRRRDFAVISVDSRFVDEASCVNLVDCVIGDKITP